MHPILRSSSSSFAPAVRATLAMVVLAAGGVASATEFGTVTAVTPAVQQVPSTQRQCWQQERLVQPPTTGGGAIAGAIVGGVLGHGLGGGPVGTALGAVVGAGVGNTAEAANTPPAAYTTERCRRVAAMRSQTVYDVQYDYGGEHYSVKMATDPGVGARIPLDVAPVGALPPGDAVASEPVESRPPTVTYAPAPAVVYPAYGYGVYPYAYAPAVTIGVGPRVWIGGRWGGWRRWH